jgi:uncharacterized membrane protein YqhA
MSGKEDTCVPGDSGSPVIHVIYGLSRWLFLLAMLGTALIAVFLFALGFLVTLVTIFTAITSLQLDVHTIKELLTVIIEIIDLFLATVFYIIALGLYELFITKAPLPGWLKICNLDDLKDKLLGPAIIAPAVLILGELSPGTGPAASLPSASL